MLARLARSIGEVADWDALASRISTVTNPVFVAIPLVLIVAWRATPSWREAMKWAGLYMLLTAIGPMGLLVLLARRGRVSDLHQARQRERLKPLIISLVWLTGVAVLFTRFDAPPLLRRLVEVQLIQAVLMTAITSFWQISFHSAGIGGLVTIALLLYRPQTWPVLLLVPLVGWAQVQRRRHTAQFS
jgi:hypothetical protein